MSPWEFLGLRQDADAASVRRRYAELLKQRRPEDDPQGFQRLRAAYEIALDVARRRPEPAAGDGPVAVADTLADSTPVAGPTTDSAPRPDASTETQPLVIDRPAVRPAAVAQAVPDPEIAAEPLAARPISPRPEVAEPVASESSAPHEIASGPAATTDTDECPPPARLDADRIAALLDGLFATCATAESPADAIAAWWSAQPLLESIEAQSLAELLLLRRLATTRGIPDGVVLALIDRFRWDDPWTARWLAGMHPQASHWLAALKPFLLRQDFVRHLQEGPFLVKNPLVHDQERRDLEALTRPLPSRRAAFLRNLANDSTSRRMVDLARHYARVHGSEAAAVCLDAEHVAFWTDLAERKRGASLRLLHSAVYLVGGILIGLLIMSITLLPPAWFPNATPDSRVNVLLGGSAVIAIALLNVLIDVGHWSRARLAPSLARIRNGLPTVGVRRRLTDAVGRLRLRVDGAAAFRRLRSGLDDSGGPALLGRLRDRIRDRFDIVRGRHPFASSIGIVATLLLAGLVDIDFGAPRLLWFSLAVLLLVRFGYRGMLSYIAAHAAVRFWVPVTASPILAVLLPTVMALLVLGSCMGLAGAVDLSEKDGSGAPGRTDAGGDGWTTTLLVAVGALLGSWYASTH